MSVVRWITRGILMPYLVSALVVWAAAYFTIRWASYRADHWNVTRH